MIHIPIIVEEAEKNIGFLRVGETLGTLDNQKCNEILE
jgi:hypothetical protein